MRTPGRFPIRTFTQSTPLQIATAPPVAPPTVDRVCVFPITTAPTTISVAFA